MSTSDEEITFLRIVDWEEKFENHRSREIRNCSWVKTPNNHDSDGFSFVITLPNGLSVYGAWQMILQVASKCPCRGDLVSDNFKPYDLETIARKTRCNLEGLREALPHLLQVEWIERVTLNSAEYRASCARSRANDAESRKEGKEQKGMEGNGTEGKELNGKNGRNMAQPSSEALGAALMFYSWEKSDRDELLKAVKKYGWQFESCCKMLCAARKVKTVRTKKRVNWTIVSTRKDDYEEKEMELSRSDILKFEANGNGVHLLCNAK